MRIKNTNDSTLSFLNFDLSDSEISSVVQVRVVPADRYMLKVAPVDADFSVFARENGTMDPWIDIGLNPIDLSGYPEDVPANFDLKVAAAATLTGIRRLVAFLSVSSDGAAGW